MPPPSLPLSLFSQTTAKPVAQAAPPPIDKQAEAMTATTTFLPKLARGGATTSNATDAVADRAKIRGSPPRRDEGHETTHKTTADIMHGIKTKQV